MAATRSPFARSEIEHHSLTDDAARLRSARPLDTVALRTAPGTFTSPQSQIEVSTGPVEKRWMFTFMRRGYGYDWTASRLGVVCATGWLRDADIVRVARVAKTMAQAHYGELELAGEV